MQPFSDDMKNYGDNVKILCRCRQVRTDLYILQINTLLSSSWES